MSSEYDFVQQITAVMSDGAKFAIFLLQAEGENSCRCEAYLRGPNGQAFKLGLPGSFADSGGAFTYIAQAMSAYKKQYKAEVIVLDNPCNADFLSPKKQKAILVKEGIFIEPLLNGKK